MRFICATLLCAMTMLTPGVASSQDWVRDVTRDLRQEQGGGPPLAGAADLGPVAVVGHGRIGGDQVLELWSPMWREVQGKVRNGKMSPQEGDAKLQEEWRKVVLALIKDETLFQEMEREHASFINSIVDGYMSRGADRPRNQLVSEINRAIEQNMQRFFRELNYEVVKDSGGAVKLHKVLESRGLTFAEWQRRLEKKAFTQTYLHEILKPRTPTPGPKQVQAYYAGNPDEFSKPGVVRFRHIFFSNAKHGPEGAKDAAVEVWERLVDGELSFEDAAQQYSDDAVSAGRGGLETEEEAQEPEREAWLADIRTALRDEAPGEVGPILESPFGCHVATLIAVGPMQRIPFAEVRQEIQRKLMAKTWEDETDRYFATIRQKTDIRILQPSFPAQLSCAALTGMPTGGPRVYSTAFPEVSAPRRGRR